MVDLIILLLIFLVLLITFNTEPIKKLKQEKFQNVEEEKRYFKYVLTDKDSKNYELLTFSQLNFKLQKTILEKLLSNENDDKYNKILDIDYLKRTIETGSRYIPINDLLVAVRSNRVLDEKVLSFKPQLLFGENNDVYYSVLDYSIVTPLPKSNLTINNDMLLLSVPDDNFNIKNQNMFQKAIIKDNKVLFKNVELVQVDDLPISLIKLNDFPTNITINKEEVFF